MSKKLSVLICGLKEREQLIMNMARVLRYQGTSDVEILANIDNGDNPIGKKRNLLLDNSKGEYICYIDDDDMISPFYISKILKAIEKKPDCVGLEGIIVQKGQGQRKFIHSVRYNDWFEENNIYYRCPNHLNPVKREFALNTRFPETYYHEDKDYSMRIKQLLKTEEYIDEPMYFYYPNS